MKRIFAEQLQVHQPKAKSPNQALDDRKSIGIRGEKIFWKKTKYDKLYFWRNVGTLIPENRSNSSENANNS